MKVPSLDKVEAIGLLAALALVGYVGYRAWKVGASAKQSVSDTMDSIGGSISQTLYKAKNLFSGASDAGPGESGAVLDQSALGSVPLTAPPIVPLGAGGQGRFGVNYGPSAALGGDDQSLGVALAQVDSPDAVTDVLVPT
jgi:hypothetical protein